MTKKEIVKALKKEGFPADVSEKFFDALLKIFKNAVLRGEKIRLLNFGTISVRHDMARPSRNPRTGENFVLPERRRIIFKPSRKLKKQLETSS